MISKNQNARGGGGGGIEAMNLILSDYKLIPDNNNEITIPEATSNASYYYPFDKKLLREFNGELLYNVAFLFDSPISSMLEFKQQYRSETNHDLYCDISYRITSESSSSLHILVTNNTDSIVVYDKAITKEFGDFIHFSPASLGGQQLIMFLGFTGEYVNKEGALYIIFIRMILFISIRE